MYAVAYATDNNYAQHVSVSLQSLFNSATSPESVDIYILDNKLSDHHRHNLIATAEKFGQELKFINISDIESRLPEAIDTSNLSISTYCRLFVTQLLPDDIDILIYLDCDTYICDDFNRIMDYAPDYNDWYVVGVEDTMYPHMKEGIGLSKDSLYINAGVLLINLKKWREDNVVGKFMDFIVRYAGAVPHLDQGVINGVFETGKLRLPLRYNVQAPIFAIHRRKDMIDFFQLTDYYDDDAIREARKNPAIIHFTSFFLERPWFRFCIHPYKHLYRQTLLSTPYANTQLMRDKIGVIGKLKDICFKYFQPLYLKLR